MSWQKIRLILMREVRDQLRDRRTLFMIFVLPILLYPLLGMSFLQVTQFIQEHPTTVLILGAENLPAMPKLIEGERFATPWFENVQQAGLLHVSVEKPAEKTDPDAATQLDRWEDEAKRLVDQAKYQVVLVVPPDFTQRIVQFTTELSHERAEPNASPTEAAASLPKILLFHNTSLEKSGLCQSRVANVLDRWRSDLGRENLAAVGLDRSAARPFTIDNHDSAPPETRAIGLWSIMFPFLLLIWALTGAFYPAVDLCAGEKERGTLETLLSSPAARSEIVWGKLLTVMLFSMTTVVLNLLSMGITGQFILSKVLHVGPPPLMSVVWVLIALVPMSALFSALCVALAAFARSSKEGQYYLMPLVLVTMPLVVISMAPGAELSLGNSLIPLAGVVLLLRTLIEGNYWQALPYVPPVIAVTLGCCLLAIRWAIDQFNTEGVIFREGERLELALWVKQLRRDREETPGVAQAVLCGVLILVIRFFMSFAIQPPTNFAQFAEVALATQLVVIATPALLMTVMLTRSPRRTLLLALPPWYGLPAVVILALGLFPLARALQVAVVKLYPVQDEVVRELDRMLTGPSNTWVLLLAMAIVPAICEELAFRGFILSGFRHLGHKWRAIVLTAMFFGATHSLVQQSLIACLLGIVLGYVAVQTGSLLPTIVLHALHNSLALLSARVTPATLVEQPGWSWIFERVGNDEVACRWPILALGAFLTVAMLYCLHRQPYRKTYEERLQEAIEHHAAPGVAG